MKKYLTLLILLSSFGIAGAQLPEFSLHVKLFINNDSARTVIFGYDPAASDSMVYGKEKWFSNEFYGGEQLYPPGQTGDLDFRMSGFYVNRPELGLDGSDGGPIDIRKKPTLDSFALQYGLEFHPVPGTTNAKMEWNPQLIPASIRHLTLASSYFPHVVRLDMKTGGSFVFPLKDSGEDLYSNMILTLYYNEDIPPLGVSSSNALQSISIFPNPLDSRSKLHFVLNENCKVTLSAFDVVGAKVFEKSINAFSGENEIELSKSDFSTHAGAYLLRLSGIQNGEAYMKTQTVIVR